MKKIFQKLRRKNKEDPCNDFSMKKLNDLSDHLVHELRTPLVAIKGGISGVRDCMGKLVQTYQIAKNNKLSIPEIFPQEFESLKEALENSEKEAYYVINYINWVSLITKEVNLNPTEFTKFFLRQCIKKAFLSYPVRTKQQENILAQDFAFKDFEILGKEDLLADVFRVIIMNALTYIESSLPKKGGIEISTSHDHRNNTLYFRSVGSRETGDDLSEIFDLFFSYKEFKFGFGLNYCKTIILQMGGEIRCQKQGKNAIEFVLSFPRI